MPKPTKPKKESNQVTFRMDPADLARLDERAAALGIARNLVARHYVEETLHRQAENAPDMVVVLLKALRLDLALSTEALLSSAGQVERAEAKAWVAENLRTPC